MPSAAPPPAFTERRDDASPRVERAQAESQQQFAEFAQRQRDPRNPEFEQVHGAPLAYSGAMPVVGNASGAGQEGGFFGAMLPMLAQFAAPLIGSIISKIGREHYGILECSGPGNAPQRRFERMRDISR